MTTPSEEPKDNGTWESLCAWFDWNRSRKLSDTEIAEAVGPVSHVIIIGQAVWINRNNGVIEDEYIEDDRLRQSILDRACHVIFRRPKHMKNGVTLIKR